MSPPDMQRIVIRLQRDTYARVRSATHGRVQPEKEVTSVFCNPNPDRTLLCAVKGLGKANVSYEVKWEVTVNRESGQFQTRFVSQRMPRA